MYVLILQDSFEALQLEGNPRGWTLIGGDSARLKKKEDRWIKEKSKLDAQTMDLRQPESSRKSVCGNCGWLVLQRGIVISFEARLNALTVVAWMFHSWCSLPQHPHAAICNFSTYFVIYSSLAT